MHSIASSFRSLHAIAYDIHAHFTSWAVTPTPSPHLVTDDLTTCPFPGVCGGGGGVLERKGETQLLSHLHLIFVTDYVRGVHMHPSLDLQNVCRAHIFQVCKHKVQESGKLYLTSQKQTLSKLGPP